MLKFPASASLPWSDWIFHVFFDGGGMTLHICSMTYMTPDEIWTLSSPQKPGDRIVSHVMVSHGCWINQNCTVQAGGKCRGSDYLHHYLMAAPPCTLVDFGDHEHTFGQFPMVHRFIFQHKSWFQLTRQILQRACMDIVAMMDLHNWLPKEMDKQGQTRAITSTPQHTMHLSTETLQDNLIVTRYWKIAELRCMISAFMFLWLVADGNIRSNQVALSVSDSLELESWNWEPARSTINIDLRLEIAHWLEMKKHSNEVSI